MRSLTPVAFAAALACANVSAQTQPAAEAAPSSTLPAVTVRASADASAGGLSPNYPGGQVARGGRAGILGTKDNLQTPFSITAYTNELIQDRQARSVGDVLQNDPAVRMARGYGNFQESFFIRGYILGSDDIAYNGLYGLLPRQYIAAELFERVEVLRGASAFLTGANPGGGGIGGGINLLPKRASDEDLTRVTVGVASGSQVTVSTDVSRRFGPDNATGVRFNAAARHGGTAVDDESNKLGLVNLGLDWHDRNVRVSGDIGWQDNRLAQTRTNVGIGSATSVPAAPDGSSNWAQPWSYSNERDVFGTLRAEVDVTDDITAWGAYGARRGKEANSLGNLDLTDASTGAATTFRFDNARRDAIDTGEAGLRGKLRTGSVKHEWVASASHFSADSKNAYLYGSSETLVTNLYGPVDSAKPQLTGVASAGDLSAPGLTSSTRLTSYALGDTLGFLDDTVLVTAGVRHQKIRSTDRAYGSGALTADYVKSRTSPVAGVVYRVAPKLSLYANYIEGLSKGDTVGGTTANPEVSVRAPYVSKQKEVGLKYDAGRVGYGLALFSTKKPRSTADAAYQFPQGVNEHRGVEVNAYGEALRGLKVLGGFTWLDTEQKDTGIASVEGKRVIGVPKFQATLGSEWEVPMVDGLAVDGRIVHTGSSYVDSANTLRVPGWTRLDLGTRYVVSWEHRPVTLRARIDNVTDRNYWASSGGYPGAGYLVAGAPRTVSVSASVDF